MSRLRAMLDQLLNCRVTKPQPDARVLPYPPGSALHTIQIVEELREALFTGCLQREKLERLFRDAGLQATWQNLSAEIDPGLLAIYKMVQPFGLGFSFLLALEQEEKDAQRKETKNA